MMIVVRGRVHLCVSVTDRLTETRNVTGNGNETVTVIEVTETVLGIATENVIGTGNATMTDLLVVMAVEEVGEGEGEEVVGVVVDGQTATAAMPITVTTPTETAQIGR